MKHASRFGTILLGMGGVVVACSATVAPSGGGGSASQTVGASGGTVTASDGTQVVIPAGALAGDVTITIALNPSAPALTQAEALATAHVFGPEGQQFLKPIQVTLAFSNLPTGVPESAIVVYTAPQGSSAYQPLPTTITDSSHVTAQTTHFSDMAPGWYYICTGNTGGGGDFCIEAGVGSSGGTSSGSSSGGGLGDAGGGSGSGSSSGSSSGGGLGDAGGGSGSGSSSGSSSGGGGGGDAG